MAYLRSPEWGLKRHETLMRFRWICQGCGRKGRALQVHHLSYKNFGNEKPEDLTVLCEKCHQKIHNKKFEYEN